MKPEPINEPKPKISLSDGDVKYYGAQGEGELSLRRVQRRGEKLFIHSLMLNHHNSGKIDLFGETYIWNLSNPGLPHFFYSHPEITESEYLNNSQNIFSEISTIFLNP